MHWCNPSRHNSLTCFYNDACMSWVRLEAPGLHTFAVFCLCCVRFLNAFKPSEPHIVPFLSQVKSFSDEQVSNCIVGVVISTPCDSA